MTAVASPTPRPTRLPVPARGRSWRRLVIAVIVAALVAVHVYAWIKTQTAPAELIKGWHGIAHLLFGWTQTFANGHAIHHTGAFPIDTSWSQTIRPGIGYCLLTVSMGLLGTTLSAPFALVFALLGSRVTCRIAPLYWLARALMSIIRAVPETVYALIFLTAVGFGPFPGVLALLLHNTAVMGKLWSEAMDEVDQGPVEALRSAGASNLQVALHAVLPAVVPQFLGLFLYRFDVNVRSSIILGIVGAGGIGFYIDFAVNNFRFDTMMTYVAMVVVLVLCIDLLSVWMRKRVSTI